MDFAEGISQAERQRKIAEILRARGQEAGPQGQMVGKQFVAPHWTQQLLPLANNLAGQYAGGKADEMEKANKQKIAQAQQDWQSALPQAKAAMAEQQGPVDPNNPMELDAQPAQPVTTGQILKHSLAGMQIPGNEKNAQMYNAGALADLTREDNQAARKEDRAAATAAALEKQKGDLEYKRDLLKSQMEKAGLDRETKSELAKQHDETLRALAAMNDATRRYGIDATRDAARDRAEAAKAAKEAKVDHLPAAQVTAYLGNKTAAANIDDALAKVEKNPKAFGLQGFLPNAILARQGTEEEKDARAAVSNIGSLKIHDRSGAAVTVSESPRLMPFIPTINDPPETVKTKLKGLKAEAERNNITIEGFAEENNYRKPGTTTPTAQTPPPVAPPKVGEVKGGHVFLGGDPSNPASWRKQ